MEKKGRDLERKVGVLEVRLMEERSKKVRVEEEMREKGNEKEGEIEELKRKVSDFKMGLVKGMMELERLEVEKKLIEEDLSESQIKEKDLELRKEELLKKVGEAEKTLLVLNERIMEPTNGVRDIKDGGQKCSLEGQLHWPVVAAGSVGALGLVAATVFVCYSKRT
ncbi:Peroxisomal and mitochondrial division factor 1 [Raphanus sativus]|uniref:Peroxisomal and mitochondrial division factor 1-like n=1 Tax=Raphanus sativus TaxID=3726 RepID=A0A9W3BU28_RAPSA|nr:peroxisomal and mitochondrial division factor 1-like [Raphanus sativus]KAJ4892194.1 Peroxisomal and mitochondrial division factor 1 [Raphanus sativus]